MVTAVMAPAHIRSMAKPGTDVGRPASSAAIRPMVSPWSPICVVAAIATSSTRSGGSSGWRRSSSRMHLIDQVVGPGLGVHAFLTGLAERRTDAVDEHDIVDRAGHGLSRRAAAELGRRMGTPSMLLASNNCGVRSGGRHIGGHAAGQDRRSQLDLPRPGTAARAAARRATPGRPPAGSTARAARCPATRCSRPVCAAPRPARPSSARAAASRAAATGSLSAQARAAAGASVGSDCGGSALSGSRPAAARACHQVRAARRAGPAVKPGRVSIWSSEPTGPVAAATIAASGRTRPGEMSRRWASCVAGLPELADRRELAAAAHPVHARTCGATGRCAAAPGWSRRERRELLLGPARACPGPRAASASASRSSTRTSTSSAA